MTSNIEPRLWTRRDTIKRTLAGALAIALGRGVQVREQGGGSLMKSLRQPPLCYRAFQLAERAERARRLPQFIPSKEIQQQTGLLIAPNSSLHGHLLFSSAGRFRQQMNAVLDELPRYLEFQDTAAWKYQRRVPGGCFWAILPEAPGSSRKRQHSPGLCPCMSPQSMPCAAKAFGLTTKCSNMRSLNPPRSLAFP